MNPTSDHERSQASPSPTDGERPDVSPLVRTLLDLFAQSPAEGCIRVYSGFLDALEGPDQSAFVNGVQEILGPRDHRADRERALKVLRTPEARKVLEAQKTVKAPKARRRQKGG